MIPPDEFLMRTSQIGYISSADPLTIRFIRFRDPLRLCIIQI